MANVRVGLCGQWEGIGCGCGKLEGGAVGVANGRDGL